MIVLRQGEEYIKLSQAMKKADLIGTGAEGKVRIREGEVQVNGEEELRPGRKLYDGDGFSYAGKVYVIRQEENG